MEYHVHLQITVATPDASGGSNITSNSLLKHEMSQFDWLIGVIKLQLLNFLIIQQFPNKHRVFHVYTGLQTIKHICSGVISTIIINKIATCVITNSQF